MYNSQYYTCEQIDERLLQGYLDDYNSQTGQSLTKAQFLTKLGSLFSKEGTIDNTLTQIGYYECDTAAGTAAKVITVANYSLFAGGSMKVKFVNKNTANNATLNINSQGAKALYYQGERASSTNSWDAGEVVEIYYDGTSYYANNVKGGSGSGVYDVSKEHPTSGPNSDGKFTLDYILNPSNVNELIPVNKRYGGMSIMFVQSSDNKYVQYRYMGTETTGTPNPFLCTANWQEIGEVFHNPPSFIQNSIDAHGDLKSSTSRIVSERCYRKCKVKTKGNYKIARIYEYNTNIISSDNYIGTEEIGDNHFEYNGPNYVTFTVYLTGSDITPSADCIESFLDLEVIEDQITEVENKVTNLTNSCDELDDRLAPLEEELNNEVDKTSSVSWDVNKFLKSDGTIIKTSRDNKVGSVDLYGVQSLKFNFSIRSGGSQDKYGWCILNSEGIVISSSETYSSSGDVDDTDAVVPVTPGGKTLYVSWNNESEGSFYLKKIYTPVKIYGELDSIRDSLSAETNSIKGEIEDTNKDIDIINEKINYTDVNIENIGVQTYMNVRYDNSDYSYTKFSYAISAVGTPEYQYPVGVIIDTPLNDTATSRTIQIADNADFDNPIVVQLDLVSETYTLYNLIGGKIYYYNVYKNNNPSNVLKQGMFSTKGSVRDLLIHADETTYGETYIGNMRDIGGWQTSGSNKIRYNCLFRGNELNHYDADNQVMIDYLTNTGKQELLNLGVSAELDLRGAEIYTESALGSDVAYANFHADLLFYRLNIYNSVAPKIQIFAEAMRQITNWLKNGKTIYVHCQGGCDRTGFLCAAIEGICGVSENDINHDYELSNRNRSREYYLISKGDNYDGDFKFAMEYIKGLLEYNGHIYVYYRNNYYDAQATVTNYTPVPISDTDLIATLSSLPFGTLKDRFRRMMKIGGMTDREMDELENVICA